MESFFRNKNIYSRVLFILILAFLCYYIYGFIDELSLHLYKINYTSLAHCIPSGLGFFYAIDCFSDTEIKLLIPIIGIYYAASLAGIATLFAPAGIGCAGRSNLSITSSNGRKSICNSGNCYDQNRHSNSGNFADVTFLFFKP
jgi:hypothetical protein